jgi:hypothetical protein
VVVAVVAVRVMEVVLHHIIDVIPMRNLRMSALWTVNMVAPVRATPMLGGAPGRVRRAHRERMLVDMVIMEMVQMPIVQIIDVVTMLNGHVPAARGVPVAVPFVHLAVRLSHVASFAPQPSSRQV